MIKRKWCLSEILLFSQLKCKEMWTFNKEVQNDEFKTNHAFDFNQLTSWLSNIQIEWSQCWHIQPNE